jgi:hypothetical protein
MSLHTLDWRSYAEAGIEKSRHPISNVFLGAADRVPAMVLPENLNKRAFLCKVCDRCLSVFAI